MRRSHGVGGWLTLGALAACGGAVTPLADGGASGDVPDGSTIVVGVGQPEAGAADAGVSRSDPGAIACGAIKCTTGRNGIGAEYCCVDTARGPLFAACKSEVVSACSGHRLSCDEKADCPSPMVCCAESVSNGPGQTTATSCMPSCITNNPRVQVCKTDAECESGACRTFECGPRAPSLRYCTKPETCR